MSGFVPSAAATTSSIGCDRRGEPEAVQEDLAAVIQIPFDVHEHATATPRDFELMREALKEVRTQ
jgi:hypothetical protein